MSAIRPRMDPTRTKTIAFGIVTIQFVQTHP
jgi:hypothetical protein